MPHAVDAANPTTVFPLILMSSFSQSREWFAFESRYKDGNRQVASLPATSRKRWVMQAKLTAAQQAALIAFYIARKGGTQEFLFYDLYETVPQFTYDETGEALAGRYVVCFEGNLQTSIGMARGSASLSLVEVS